MDPLHSIRRIGTALAALTILLPVGCLKRTDHSSLINDHLSWHAYTDSIGYTPASENKMEGEKLPSSLEITVDFTYPISKGEYREVADSICSTLSRSFFADQVAPNTGLPAAADSFFIATKKEYLDELQASQARANNEQEHYPVIREEKYVNELIYNDKNFICIEISKYAYRGGAHGYLGKQFLNHDLLSNKTMKLRDVLSNPSDPQLIEMIIRRLEEMFQVDNKASLEEIGIFSVEEIGIPETFHFDSDSLYFHYNPYEIAAYAVGHIEAGISLTSVKPLLKPKFRERILASTR